MRGGCAFVTIPKLPLSLMLPPGFMNCAWLKMLKNSMSKSNAICSRRTVRFSMPKSVLLNPGPWKKCRFAVPNVPGVVLRANARWGWRNCVRSPASSGIACAASKTVRLADKSCVGRIQYCWINRHIRRSLCHVFSRSLFSG